MTNHPPRTEATDALARSEPLGELERAVSTVAGAALAAAGLARIRRSGVLGAALAIAGAYSVYRGATGDCPISRAITKRRASHHALRRGPHRARAAITIDARPEEVYGLWRDLSNLPRFMRHLASVRVEGTRSRWELELASRHIAWDAELVEDAPGRLLAWRTLPGQAIHHEGVVRFVPAPGDRGTEVHVELTYDVPGGRMTSALASLLGAAPEQQLRSDLRRLKQLLEAGELATTRGQPAGGESTALVRIDAIRERIETAPPHATHDLEVEREVERHVRPNGHSRRDGNGAPRPRGAS